MITREFAWLLATQSLFGLGFSLFFLLPKFMTQELGANARDIGLVAALAPAAGVLAIPFIAGAIDRFGRRKLVVAGACLMTLTSAGFLWVDRVGPLLLLLRVVQGLAFSIAFNASATLAADLAPKRRLSQALGWFGLAFLATNSAAPLLAEPLAAYAGWPVVFIFSSLIIALSTLVAFRLPDKIHKENQALPDAHPIDAQPLDAQLLESQALASSPSASPPPSEASLTPLPNPQGSPHPSAASQTTNSWAILLDRRVLAMYFASFVAGVGLGAAFTFHQPFAISLGAATVGGFFLGYTASAVSVRVFLGSLPDRLGRLRLGRLSLAGYVVVLIGMTQLTPSLLIPLGVCFGLVHGLLYPSLNAVAVERASDEQRGKVMSFYNGSFNLGVAIASFGLGFVAEHTSYSFVFWITAGVVALALPVLLFIREEAEADGAFSSRKSSESSKS